MNGRTMTIRRIGVALIDALGRFNDKGGWVMSSHVAMSILLALFPFILFVVAMSGTLARGVDVEDLIGLIFGTWPDAIAAPITYELRQVLALSSGGLVTLSGLLTLIFASNGVDAVRAAITTAYCGTDRRPFWKQRLLVLGFVVVGAVVVLAVAILGVAAPLYLRFVSDALPGPLGGLFASGALRNVLTLALLVFGVAACHLWMPQIHRPLSRLWPGIVLTVLGWIVAAQGFALYLSKFALYSATYAGLAGVMTALIFLYLMSAILILGAELNGALVDRAEAGTPRSRGGVD
jgi:membrane protein